MMQLSARSSHYSQISENLGQQDVPLLLAVDPARFGGALLLTSACEAKTGEIFGGGGLSRWKLLKGHQDEPLLAGDLLVPGGGPYRAENVELYRRQALLGCEVLAEVLIEAGVAQERIIFEYFENGRDDDPAGVVRNFFSNLPEKMPDALVYYSGPTDANGRWALGWVGSVGLHRSSLLSPQDLLPDLGADDGPPGKRFVVAEASSTAALWLKPHPRLLGLAAWEGDASFGGEEGPLLARWLAGFVSKVPNGAVVCPPPEEIGMLKLAAYVPLFWCPAPPSGAAAASATASLVWELETFSLSNTGTGDQAAACTELLGRGTVQLLSTFLRIQCEATEDTRDDEASPAMLEAQEALKLQLLRVLHMIVLHAAVERWLGSMQEVLTLVMTIHSDWLENRCSPAMEAAILNVAAACLGMCSGCRQAVAGTLMAPVLALVLDGLRGLHGDEAIIAACHVFMQVASHEPLECTPDVTQVLERIEAILLEERISMRDEAGSEIIQVTASNALIFASLRSNAVKLQVLQKLGGKNGMVRLFANATSQASARLLALVRSLAAVKFVSTNAEEIRGYFKKYDSIDSGKISVDHLPEIFHDLVGQTAGERRQSKRPEISRSGTGALSHSGTGALSRSGTGLLSRAGSKNSLTSQVSEGSKADLVVGTEKEEMDRIIESVDKDDGGFITFPIFQDLVQQVEEKLKVIRFQKAFPAKLYAETVITAISRYPTDAEVQRWGHAALGALCAGSPKLAEVASGEEGTTCVIWGLGANVMKGKVQVEQEALFCAYSMLKSESGRKNFINPSSRLPGLVSSSVKGAILQPETAISEVPLWGMRVMEVYAFSHGGAALLEPHMDAIVGTLMTPSCRDSTIIAGSAAVSYLAARSPTALDHLKGHRVQMVKELRRRAYEAAERDDTPAGRAKEKEIQQWANVLMDVLGGHKLGAVDENTGEPPEGAESDAQFAHVIKVGLNGKKINHNGTPLPILDDEFDS